MPIATSSRIVALLAVDEQVAEVLDCRSARRPTRGRSCDTETTRMPGEQHGTGERELDLPELLPAREPHRESTACLTSSETEREGIGRRAHHDGDGVDA